LKSGEFHNFKKFRVCETSKFRRCELLSLVDVNFLIFCTLEIFCTLGLVGAPPEELGAGAGGRLPGATVAPPTVGGDGGGCARGRWWGGGGRARCR
jgi:hypothetical protein